MKPSTKLAENIAGCLKLISDAETLTLDPTDGTETIAEATDLFVSIDRDFKNWETNVPGQPTGKTEVHVHEMVKDGDFRKIFGGLSDNLDSLCLTQGQIVQFVRNHRNWLRTDGYSTFFLFKVGDKFFVAGPYSTGDLRVFVGRFSDDCVWFAEDRHRVVVPARNRKELKHFVSL